MEKRLSGHRLSTQELRELLSVPRTGIWDGDLATFVADEVEEADYGIIRLDDYGVSYLVDIGGDHRRCFSLSDKEAVLLKAGMTEVDRVDTEVDAEDYMPDYTKDTCFGGNIAASRAG